MTHIKPGYTYMEKLLNIMALLRDPKKGCPWDQQQTLESIIPHTLEEVYELIEVIEKKQWSELSGELGDLLLQIVFYAQIAKEQGMFEFYDVIDELCEKMERRHPHVFGNETITSIEQQKIRWEEIKAREIKAKELESTKLSHQDTSALSNMNHFLPALPLANKLQNKAAKVNFDWTEISDVFAKLQEEINEVKEAIVLKDKDAIEDEIGDLLFMVVNLARHNNIDPEKSLRRSNRKFEQRFRLMESLMKKKHTCFQQLDINEMEDYWQQAKKIIRNNTTDSRKT